MDYYQLGYSGRKGVLPIGAQRHFQKESFALHDRLHNAQDQNETEAKEVASPGEAKVNGPKHDKDNLDGKRAREESGQGDSVKRPKPSIDGSDKGKHDLDGETKGKTPVEGGTSATHQEGDGDAVEQRVTGGGVRSKPKQGDAEQTAKPEDSSGEVQQRRGDAGSSSGQVRAGGAASPKSSDGSSATDLPDKE